MSDRALEAIDQSLSRSEDADEVLRDTVRVLAAEPAISWAGIAFLDTGVLTLGPSAGVADDSRRRRTPITFQGTVVGELWIDGEADEAVLARVASVIAAHVLIGWDTGGEPWEP